MALTFKGRGDLSIYINIRDSAAHGQSMMRAPAVQRMHIYLTPSIQWGKILYLLFRIVWK